MGDEVECAGLTKGAAGREIASAPVYALWAVAAQFDVAILAERVPPKVNPADPPCRSEELSPPTEPHEELPIIDEFFSLCDRSWMLRRTDWSRMLQSFTGSTGWRGYHVPRIKDVGEPSTARDHAFQLTRRQ